MKKAKRASEKVKRESAKKDALNELKIYLIIDRKYTIEELPSHIQSRFFAISGSIRQLMASHNALIESARGQSEANQRAIFSAAVAIEETADQKIDSMNEFLDREFAKVAVSQKRKRKSSKRSVAMQKAWKKRKQQQHEKSKKPRRKASKKNLPKVTRKLIRNGKKRNKAAA